MTARTQLETELKKVIPRAWKLVPYQDNLDRLDRVTLVLKQNTIAKAAQAPQGAYLISYVLTLVTPEIGAQKAETALDDSVAELLTALDSITWLNWSLATKVQFSDSNMAYDITVEVITRKAN